MADHGILMVQFAKDILRGAESLGEFLSLWKPTYFILLTLVAILLISMFRREFLRRKSCWLSDKIEKAKAELKGVHAQQPWFRQPKLYLSQFYYPTVQRLAVLVLFMTAFFGFCNMYFGLPYDGAEFYRSLAPIQIGLVALIFPVMIFIIGFSGNKLASGVNLSEVLLRESFLFPVGVIGLFFLVNLIWARSSCVVIVQILLSAFMYAVVLFRIIKILLNDKRLLDKSKELLKDKLRQSIEKTIGERLGNNLLMKEFGENKIELQYAFFDPERKGEKYVHFDLRKRGVITNINLNALGRIAKIVEKTSRARGFSFYENILDLSNDENKDTTSVRNDEEGTKTYRKSQERYLRKRFMDEVSDEYPHALSIRKELIDDQSVVTEIDHIVNTAFCVSKKDDETDKLRIELRNLKDQLIDEVRNKRLGRISNLKEVYITFAELFLDTMKAYSSNYTMEMARKERSSFIDEWAEIRWLTDDLRDVYQIAMETHDINVIQEIGYLPIAIAHRAIKRHDHYIFEKSFGFLYLYNMYALREEDKDLSSFMKERCGMYLSETAEHAIQYELEKVELGQERVGQFRDFAAEVFLQLQQLLKQSYDKKDFASFQSFVVIGKKLFSHFKPSEEHLNADHYKWQLKISDLKDDEKEQIEGRLKEREFLEGVEGNIREKKQEMFFGLAAFILDQYRCDKTKKDLLEYFNVISSALPSDFKELTKIFIKCHDFDIEHFWGWEWWILPMDGEVHCVDFPGKTTFLYCVKTLKIIAAMTDSQIEAAELPHTRDFVHMIEKDDSAIRKTIDELLSDISQWSGIIPTLDQGKRTALYKAFDRVKEQQNREDDDFLIGSSLSSEKLTEFVKGFLESYRGNSGVHVAFQKLGQYEDKAGQIYRGDRKSVGYNRLDEKGAFVDGWYVHYSRWGEQYGSGIATSENTYLFEQLCKPLTPTQSTKENIIGQIETAVQRLRNEGYGPNVIIASLDFDDYRTLSSDNRFIPHWHKDCPQKGIPNFHGVLRFNDEEIPVIRLYREKNKGLVGIFDLKKFAILSQLRPWDNESEAQYIQGNFYIRIIDLNQDSEARSSIVSSSPEWLNKYPDKERYLKTKVIVKTFIRQELCVNDPKAGVLLKVDDHEEGVIG